LSIALCGATAHAAVISWSAATNISGDADVVTNGTLVGAFNVGGPGVGSTTINGVPFGGFALSSSSSTVGNFSFAIGGGGSLGGNNSVGSANSPFAGLSAGYQSMLSSIAGDFAPFTLTMSGLTIGDQYEFEWWNNDSNLVTDLVTSATAGSSVTLSSNISGANGGLGQFATGTFTADAATQVITFSTVGPEDQLDGFQLRQIAAVPAPSTDHVVTVFLAVGAMLFGARLLKRKRSVVCWE
jgi:hypothetical protein